MPRLLFIPGKDPVPIVQEAGWAPGPVWTGAENLGPLFDPRTTQPVASHYTHCATRPTVVVVVVVVVVVALIKRNIFVVEWLVFPLVFGRSVSYIIPENYLGTIICNVLTQFHFVLYLSRR
jgi:hypothetical protein